MLVGRWTTEEAKEIGGEGEKMLKLILGRMTSCKRA